MRLNPYKTDVTPQKLFEDLSSKSFNSQLEIQQVKQGRNNIDFAVTEISKFYWLNPVRLVYSPEAEGGKLAMATNLAAMVKMYAGTVVDHKGCNGEVIKGNLERMSKRILKHTSAANGKAIEAKFQEAISTLTSAAFNKESWFFAHDRIGFRPESAVDHQDFYRQFSKTSWFGLVGGFNQRVRVIEPSKGGFEIYTASKPWFSSLDFFGKPVSAAVKVAAAQNLAKMIEADSELIVDKRLNVAGMIQNLEAMKKAMPRNTTLDQGKMIVTSLDKAISELKEDAKAIDESISCDLHRVVGRFVRDWMILTPYSIGKFGVTRVAYPVLKGTAKGGWWIASNATTKVAFPALKGVWNVASYPVRYALSK